MELPQSQRSNLHFALISIVLHIGAHFGISNGNIPIAREVDNVLHELHTYFSKFPKRLHRLRTWLKLFDDPDLRILKPTNVRRLSRYGYLEKFFPR